MTNYRQLKKVWRKNIVNKMSKRRNGSAQVRREDYEATEEPSEEAGSFARASEDKIKSRRIVKAR